MLEKGYPHPLYSLDLVPHAAQPEDEPRFAILLPEGRLVVRAELRRRAQDHSVLAIDHLVGTALAHHRLSVPGFERFGLGAKWADHLRCWRARMLEEDEVGMALAVELEQQATRIAQLQEEGRAALEHLRLSARLAGLGAGLGTRLGPRRPRAGAAALAEALRGAAAEAAAQVPAALLARSGFSARDRVALSALAEALPRQRDARAALDARCREQRDGLLVIKAALLGDAARLCQAAPQVLGPERCRALRVSELLRDRALRPA